MAEVLAGKLTFNYSSGNGSGSFTVEEYDGAPVLKLYSAKVYVMNGWQGSTSNIQIGWALGEVEPGMPYLSEVLVNP